MELLTMKKSKKTRKFTLDIQKKKDSSLWILLLIIHTIVLLGVTYFYFGGTLNVACARIQGDIKTSVEITFNICYYFVLFIVGIGSLSAILDSVSN